MGVHLPPFDASRDFVTARNFRYNGVIYLRLNAEGEPDPFPKDGVPERKLRQLYETRNIAYSGVDQIRQIPHRGGRARPAKRPDAAGPDDAEAEQTKKLMRKTHSALVKLANGLDGVTAKSTKAQLAEALVKAGRVGGDGTA